MVEYPTLEGEVLDSIPRSCKTRLKSPFHCIQNAYIWCIGLCSTDLQPSFTTSVALPSGFLIKPRWVSITECSMVLLLKVSGYYVRESFCEAAWYTWALPWNWWHWICIWQLQHFVGPVTVVFALQCECGHIHTVIINYSGYASQYATKMIRLSSGKSWPQH